MPARLPEQLRPLFWEADFDSIEVEKHADSILTRVLEHGRLGDVKWLMATYGMPRIHRFFREVGHPELSDRTIAFWRALFDAEDEEWGKPTGLAKEQQRALGRLKTVGAIERFYLVGGTAISYHLHHRQSLDLDLFSLQPGVDIDELRNELRSRIPELQVISASDATLKAELEGTLVDIVSYPYPPLETPAAGPGGFPVAGLLDLATMKLAAISRRGIRRDFWDLYAIAQSGISLSDAANAYLRHFGAAEPELYHVLRSLAYFTDAEKDPLFPAGLDERRWEEIKRFFIRHAPPLLDSLTT